jgi:riboflavin biosynthesis pyrimidine reductase
MVGAGTVRTERYGRVVRDPALRERRRREGLAEDPLACVVSASLEGLADVPLLEAAEQRVVVVTAAEGELPPAAPPVEYLRARRAAASAVASEEGASASGAVDARAALERLRADWGVRSVLCEGGPTLNAELLRAGVVDELFLSLAPKLAGGAAALTIVAGAALPETVELELVSLLEHEGELFLRLRVGDPAR